MAGLYQVNFTIPSSGLTNGDASIGFDTDEALNVMSTISVSGFTGRALGLDFSALRSMSRRRAAANPTFGKHTKNLRRGLPGTVKTRPYAVSANGTSRFLNSRWDTVVRSVTRYH